MFVHVHGHFALLPFAEDGYGMYKGLIEHTCTALLVKLFVSGAQYLCQSFTPANPFLCGNVFVSVKDITWLLKSVRSL